MAIPDDKTEECSQESQEKEDSAETNVIFANGPEKCGSLHHCYCWIKYNLWMINKDSKKQTESIDKLIQETRKVIEESRIQREKSMETFRKYQKEYETK